jgi:hypothetical protein
MYQDEEGVLTGEPGGDLVFFDGDCYIIFLSVEMLR